MTPLQKGSPVHVAPACTPTILRLMYTTFPCISARGCLEANSVRKYDIKALGVSSRAYPNLLWSMILDTGSDNFDVSMGLGDGYGTFKAEQWWMGSYISRRKSLKRWRENYLSCKKRCWEVRHFLCPLPVCHIILVCHQFPSQHGKICASHHDYNFYGYVSH
jgi:hypothetical protein